MKTLIMDAQGVRTRDLTPAELAVAQEVASEPWVIEADYRTSIPIEVVNSTLNALLLEQHLGIPAAPQQHQLAEAIRRTPSAQKHPTCTCLTIYSDTPIEALAAPGCAWEPRPHRNNFKKPTK